MADGEQPTVADLSGEAHRFLEAHLRRSEVVLEERNHAQVVLGHADHPPLTDLFANSEGVLVHLTCLFDVADTLGDEGEVAEQARST